MKMPKRWNNKSIFASSASGVSCWEDDGRKFLDVSDVMADGKADAKHVRKLAEKLLAAAAWLEAK